jgi:hypothetical protein
MPNSPRLIQNAPAATPLDDALAPFQHLVTPGRPAPNNDRHFNASITNGSPKATSSSPAFNFQNAIKVERQALFAEIRKSLDTNYEPMLSSLPAKRSIAQRIGRLSSGSQANRQSTDSFDILFKKVSNEFQHDVESIALDQVKPEGRLFKYVKGKSAAERKKLLLAMNDFFGMVLTFPSNKRRQALDALLTMPDGDLNCADGMVERLNFIKTSLSADNPFLMQSYADVERKVIFGERQFVNVHTAHSKQKDFYANLTENHGVTIHQKTAQDIEAFLDNDIQKLLDDLTDIISRKDDAATTVDALKACQEKHLPTLHWFFPPKEELTQASAAQHAAQLHQHADYFELDDDQIEFAFVKQQNIVRDAVKIAMPALKTESRILIAHQNPAHWATLSSLFFPQLVKDSPSLTHDNFFNEMLEKTFLSEMIVRGESIGYLLEAQVLPLPSFFKRNDGMPSFIEQIIEKGSDSGTLEKLYLQSMQSVGENEQHNEHLDQLQRTAVVKEINQHVMQMQDIENLQPESVRQLLTQLKATFDKIETPEFKAIAVEKVAQAFEESINVLVDEKKLMLLDTMNATPSVDEVPSDLSMRFAKTLLNTVAPATTRLQTTIHSGIIDYVDRISKQKAISDQFEVESRLDLCIVLIEKMGDLHAATMRSGAVALRQGELSPKQNPQMKAYKLLKWQLSMSLGDPKTSLKMMNALWQENRLDRLDNATRTPTKKHWAKAGMALVSVAYGLVSPPSALVFGILFRKKLQDIWHQLHWQPLAGIREAAIRMTGTYLIYLRQGAMVEPPEMRAQTLQEILTTWGTVIHTMTAEPTAAEATDRTAEAPTATEALVTNRTNTILPEVVTQASAATQQNTKFSPIDQARVIGLYIEELDAHNFIDALSADALAAAKVETLDRIDAEQLHLMAPHMYKYSKVAYVEFIEYLFARQGARGVVTEERIQDIAQKINYLESTHKKTHKRTGVNYYESAETIAQHKEKILSGVQRIKAALPLLADTLHSDDATHR